MKTININQLPLHIYENILKSSNLLLLNFGDFHNKYEDLLFVFDDIQKQIFDITDVEDKQIIIMKFKIEYLENMKLYYLKNDKFKKTLANLAKQKMDLYKEDTNVEINFVKVCVTLSKVFGFGIKYMDLSVGEFYNYIKLAETFNKSV